MRNDVIAFLRLDAATGRILMERVDRGVKTVSVDVTELVLALSEAFKAPADTTSLAKTE